MLKGKTVIKRKVKNEKQTKENIISKENPQSKMIKGKTQITNRKKVNKKPEEEKNSSEYLIEQIIISYCIDKWQKKVEAIKNRVSGRNNKESKNLRFFANVLKKSFRYHKYLYLMELFEKMSQLPPAEGVVHDPNFGKIKIVYNGEKEDLHDDKKEFEIEIEKIVIDNGHENLKNIKKDEHNDNSKFKEENEELKDYFYRNDGKKLDAIEIEKDINKLIDLNPEKDIDVERILKSKRLQYKMKHPRFSPFTKKENLDSYIRYLYTYKGNEDNKENLVLIKNKTYAYY